MCVSLRRVRAVSCVVGCLLGAVACNDLSGLAGVQALPTGTPDPKSLRTPAGAIQLYNAVVSAFGQGQMSNSQSGHTVDGALVGFTGASGLLADEFRTGTQTTASTYSADFVDARAEQTDLLSAGFGDGLYSALQGIRGGASEAIGSLAVYGGDSTVALRGHMYALRGYADIFLADLYCSGVPLSTLDFNGNYTYGAPSTTAQIYQAAIANFDTALTLSADSAQFLNLARVGEGRAYLALGQYDSAAAAVAVVPDDFLYSFPVQWQLTSLNGAGNFSDPLELANSEGGNGLPYLANGDPRDSAQYVGTNPITGVPVYWPLKYGGTQLATGVGTPMVVASGIEARLIQAEAAWNGVTTGTGTWLDQLNTLRQNNAVTSSLPALPNSWITDSTPQAQVDLIFRERAYWLYVTGHRQGDLRRLIRNYGRDPDTVYPTGAYRMAAIGRYGTEVDLSIPSSESANPLYQGCLARGA